MGSKIFEFGPIVSLPDGFSNSRKLKAML